MAAEETRPTNPEQNPPAQPKRPTTGVGSERQPTPPPSAPREPTRSSVGGKTCEVLKDSCKEPADWVAKTPDGVEIYVCEEHKPLIAQNYPDTQFEYEEV